MAIIAFLDLLSALCVIVGSTWKWIVGYSVLDDGTVWCHINSLVGWSVTISALNVMALLSLVRYLTIVRGKEIHNSAIIVIACTIISGITLLFGVKQIVNKPVAFTSGMYCAAVWSDGAPLSSTLSIIIWIVALPPLFIIPICYARVTSYYTSIVLGSSGEYLPRKLYKQRQSLILVIICYIMTLLPEYTQAFVSVIFKLELISWMRWVMQDICFHGDHCQSRLCYLVPLWHP
ncbi:hypothetical protein DSO57_1038296 [Entomophthora muscae]|uniref:Uncharacterized protein n=1 Tax=Entomophthora muscae TaxID=34485 RepID=A0ACC2TWM8_9FUNG|nr:hypothetical protein DSO57_1038296 [Entomophthora muscae]